MLWPARHLCQWCWRLSRARGGSVAQAAHISRACPTLSGGCHLMRAGPMPPPGSMGVSAPVVAEAERIVAASERRARRRKIAAVGLIALGMGLIGWWVQDATASRSKRPPVGVLAPSGPVQLDGRVLLLRPALTVSLHRPTTDGDDGDVVVAHAARRVGF